MKKLTFYSFYLQSSLLLQSPFSWDDRRDECFTAMIQTLLRFDENIVASLSDGWEGAEGRGLQGKYLLYQVIVLSAERL